jgi:ABC-type sugar transport system permease subunit
LFLLPALIVYVLIVLYPAASTVLLSFFRWDGISTTRTWIGLENYVQMVGDEVAMLALWHNFLWVVGAVLVPLVAGLILSTLLVSANKGRLVFRVIFFLPMILPPVVTAIVWEWMFNSTFGMINAILRAVGLDFLAMGWLGNTVTALPALILTFSWSFFGFCLVVLLSAMQNIDPALPEAAKIEGANATQIFFNVTLPSIKNEMTFMTIYTAITALKIFDLPYIMTSGGPAYSTEVIATFMYRMAFVDNKMGYGAAAATTMMVIVVIAFQFVRSRGEE